MPPQTGRLELPCRKCEHKNELPYAFCEECGAPRVVLGRIRVLGNLSLSVTAFLGFYYFNEVMDWAWPIYTLYSLFVLQIAMLMVQESRIKTTRTFLWYLAFLGFGGYLAHNFHTEGPGIFVLFLRDIPMMMSEEPWVFFPVVGGILTVAFLPLYMRWGRIYGWVNAYRIALLSMFMVLLSILIIFRLMGWVETSQAIPRMVEFATDFNDTVRPKYERNLTLMAVNILRVFLFEIFVFSAVRGYTVAKKDVYKLDRERLEKESAFSRSLLIMAQVVRRFYQALENMVHYLIETCLKLSRHIGHVIIAFFRELAVPIVALTSAVFLIYAWMHFTVVYIEAPSMQSLAMIVGTVAGLLVCEMLFLLCKSRYRPARIFSVHLQIGGWLLPNVLVCFLLVSVSLWATSLVLNEEGAAQKLPFRLGPLTIAVGAMLVVLVAIVLYRKRSLFTTIRDDLASVDPKKEDVPNFEPSEPVIEDADDLPAQDPEPAVAEPVSIQEQGEEEYEPASGEVVAAETTPVKRRKKKSWDLGQARPAKSEKMLEKLGQFTATAKGAIEGSGLGDKARQALSKASDKISGKPVALTKLEETEASLTAAQRRLEGLQSVRETVSQETFNSMRNNLQDEIERLTIEREQLRQIVGELHGKAVLDFSEASSKLSALQTQLEEVKALKSSGAIPESEADNRIRNLDAQVKFQSGSLKTLEKRVAILEPWVTANG